MSSMNLLEEQRNRTTKKWFFSEKAAEWNNVFSVASHRRPASCEPRVKEWNEAETNDGTHTHTEMSWSRNGKKRTRHDFSLLPLRLRFCSLKFEKEKREKKKETKNNNNNASQSEQFNDLSWFFFVLHSRNSWAVVVVNARARLFSVFNFCIGFRCVHSLADDGFFSLLLLLACCCCSCCLLVALSLLFRTKNCIIFFHAFGFFHFFCWTKCSMRGFGSSVLRIINTYVKQSVSLCLFQHFVPPCLSLGRSSPSRWDSTRGHETRGRWASSKTKTQ